LKFGDKLDFNNWLLRYQILEIYDLSLTNTQTIFPPPNRHVTTLGYSDTDRQINFN